MRLPSGVTTTQLSHSTQRRLVIGLLLALAPFAVGQTPQAVAQTGFASTVTVLVYDQAGNALALGSGFVIAQDEVVTNAHVIAGAHSALVRAIGQADPLNVTSVEQYDPANDLAILAVPGLELPPLAFHAEDAPSVGDAVFAVGSPLGLEGTFTQGIVSGYQTIENTSLIQITAPISPGSSGGPVLNLQGRVVGVAMGTFANGQNLNFAIPVTTLAELTKQPANPRPVNALASESATPSGRPGAQDLVNSVDFGGVGLRVTGLFSFSARNNLPRSIENVEVAVTFYDATEFPLSTEHVTIPGPIAAGLGARAEFRLEEGVQDLITDRYNSTTITTRVEFRVLAFEYAD